MAKQITIISETPQVTFPRPGESVVQIALTYQVDAGPPRTIWIPQTNLPDLVYLATHPFFAISAGASAEMVKKGDDARRVVIRADIEKRAKKPATRTLEI